MAMMGYMLLAGVAVVTAVVFFWVRKNNRRADDGIGRISITGTAVYIKGKPAVVADGGGYGAYFIKNMNTWEEGWLYQRLRIIGELELNRSDECKYICDPVMQLIGAASAFK